jgi:CHAT domain-containing protein
VEYFDFELKIGAGSQGSFPVEVLRSPAGEQRGTLTMPWNAQELPERIAAVERAVRTRGGSRGVDMGSTGPPAAVPEFGAALFRAVMPESVRSCYRTSRALAAQSGKGLRLRLRIDDPAVAALPWELLFDDEEGDFVSLSNATPIVRHLELGRGIAPLSVQPPLRILAMVSGPRDLPALSVAHERDRMEQALAPLVARGDATLTWLEGDGSAALQRAMRSESGPWHVFHFIGHGGFDAASGEGILMLTGDDGASVALPATQLGRLLSDHGSLRLAVLNACDGARGDDASRFSSTAAVLMRRGLPAVVAMQHPISDDSAIEFSREFYGGLAGGLPVDGAVAEGRKAVSLLPSGGLEWGTPVLHMRSADGQLFDLSRPEVEKEELPPIPGTGPWAKLVPALIILGLLGYVVFILLT